MIFSNPKRSRATANKKEFWFKYYAGFSASFVRTALKHLLLDKQCTVLDPWNGSGTTTTTAYELGIGSVGIDINPVMIVVAKAKILGPNVQKSLAPLAINILAKASEIADETMHHNEPLLEWFAPQSAKRIRDIERAIRELLTPLQPHDSLFSNNNLNHVSNLAAFFLVALLRTARSFLTRFNTSNPTWIKSPSYQQRVRPSLDTLSQSFLYNVQTMSADLVLPVSATNTRVLLASSESIPLCPHSVKAVVGSPPYCTRIDYAIATKPELATLGCSSPSGFEAIRRQMTGGPLVSTKCASPMSSWGPSCLGLLDKVAIHPSKGSRSYYYKILTQYYKSIHDSIMEINRILEPNGDCILVLQDSYYKEIHVDVAKHIIEMTSAVGWVLEHKCDFEARSVMARVNSKARKYRNGIAATESVLWFRTAS